MTNNVFVDIMKNHKKGDKFQTYEIISKIHPLINVYHNCKILRSHNNRVFYIINFNGGNITTFNLIDSNTYIKYLHFTDLYKKYNPYTRICNVIVRLYKKEYKRIYIWKKLCNLVLQRSFAKSNDTLKTSIDPLLDSIFQLSGGFDLENTIIDNILFKTIGGGTYHISDFPSR